MIDVLLSDYVMFQDGVAQEASRSKPGNTFTRRKGNIPKGQDMDAAANITREPSQDVFILFANDAQRGDFFQH